MANVIRPISEDYRDTVTGRKRCMRKYYITGTVAYKNSVLPEYGRPYDSFVDDWPGDEYRVEDSSCDAVSHPNTLLAWILTVQGSTSADIALPNKRALLSKIKRNMGREDVTVQAVWLGAHKADKDDAAEAYSEGTVRKAKAKVNPAGSQCKKGEYIFNNATAPPVPVPVPPATDDSAGSATVKNSPYIKISDPALNALSPNAIGLVGTHQTHHVEYYAKRPPDAVFAGVVLAWPKDLGPATRGTPAVDGQWRCKAQTYVELNDIGTRNIYKITRVFIRVPLDGNLSDIQWNSARYGIWSASWR